MLMPTYPNGFGTAKQSTETLLFKNATVWTNEKKKVFRTSFSEEWKISASVKIFQTPATVMQRSI
jgi:hypothetical protein